MQKCCTCKLAKLHFTVLSINMNFWSKVRAGPGDQITSSVRRSGCSQKAPLWDCANVKTFRRTRPRGSRSPSASPRPPAWSLSKKPLVLLVNEGLWVCGRRCRQRGTEASPGWTRALTCTHGLNLLLPRPTVSRRAPPPWSDCAPFVYVL